MQTIMRDCDCPLYIDTINGNEDRKQPHHVHLALSNPDGTDEFYLNNYDEKTLLSQNSDYDGNHDWIEILEQDQPVQTTLF